MTDKIEEGKSEKCQGFPCHLPPFLPPNITTPPMRGPGGCRPRRATSRRPARSGPGPPPPLRSRSGERAGAEKVLGSFAKLFLRSKKYFALFLWGIWVLIVLIVLSSGIKMLRTRRHPYPLSPHLIIGCDQVGGKGR